jgi:hypothetical protein
MAEFVGNKENAQETIHFIDKWRLTQDKSTDAERFSPSAYHSRAVCTAQTMLLDLLVQKRTMLEMGAKTKATPRTT